MFILNYESNFRIVKAHKWTHIVCMWLALFVVTIRIRAYFFVVVVVLLSLVMPARMRTDSLYIFGCCFSSLYHYSVIFHSLALITNNMPNVQRTITFWAYLWTFLYSSCSCWLHGCYFDYYFFNEPSRSIIYTFSASLWQQNL